jgi:hypothetical protein
MWLWLAASNNLTAAVRSLGLPRRDDVQKTSFTRTTQQCKGEHAISRLTAA